jgi:hypothetical protein
MFKRLKSAKTALHMFDAGNGKELVLTYELLDTFFGERKLETYIYSSFTVRCHVERQNTRRSC